eukprot:TRINITY_DN14823_c0_g1_i1.p1 TRINITY_DN14823_c0_g1~~TRINITY_DN14823_c0_g1_i1.p1  ORF type:complete len:227 (+),score=46.30 TRINITY_DN14823_c0_g1_i1:56-736(+)
MGSIGSVAATPPSDDHEEEASHEAGDVSHSQPSFLTMAGAEIDGDFRAIRNGAEAREKLAAVLNMPGPQCLHLVSQSGSTIEFHDPLPDAKDGPISVVVDTEAVGASVFLGDTWSARYHTHGVEQIKIEFDGSSRNHIAIKITGDPHVPKGQWTWKTSEPLRLKTKVKGLQQLRYNIYNPWGYEEIPVELEAVSENEIKLHGGVSVMSFRRAEMKDGPQKSVDDGP